MKSPNWDQVHLDLLSSAEVYPRQKKMPDKLKIAIARGATCSGCDIEIVDINERLLEVVEIADIVSCKLAGVTSSCNLKIQNSIIFSTTPKLSLG